jgi:putative NADPH-quinone reductase
MPHRIAIIQGHPDRGGAHLCHALANAYAQGAAEGGHDVKRIEVAHLDFTLLSGKEEFEKGSPPIDIRAAQEAILWADRLLIIYPLWLGAMPALLKGFFEQVFRPDFAFDYRASGLPAKRLKGRAARIVVTMGMPALAYRWYFGAHSLKSLERNILAFCGIGPIRESLFGMVETAGEGRRRKWLDAMRACGRRAD